MADEDMHNAPSSGSDSDTDSQDSDQSEAELDQADMDRIMQLEAQLENNPNLYDAHKEVRSL